MTLPPARDPRCFYCGTPVPPPVMLNGQWVECIPCRHQRFTLRVIQSNGRG